MGASSYQLYWSTNASGPFILVADNITSNSYTNSVTIGGVTNYYTVASSNAAGISSQSDAKSLLPSIPSISAVLEGNMILPESSACQTSCHSGIDAATQPQNSGFETTFVKVIA